MQSYEEAALIVEERNKMYMKSWEELNQKKNLTPTEKKRKQELRAKCDQAV
jgi:hypothetical protein